MRKTTGRGGARGEERHRVAVADLGAGEQRWTDERIGNVPLVNQEHDERERARGRDRRHDAVGAPFGRLRGGEDEQH